MPTVAELARRLNSRARAGRRLPPLWLMSDERRLPDPRPWVARLAGVGGLILRHYDDPGRGLLARELALPCRASGVPLLIGADAALAAAVRADGVHLPDALIERAIGIRRGRPGWLVTAAAHGARSLRRARLAGVDAALLAPFFATPSHPDACPLGPLLGARLARAAGLPVYALGGIDPGTARRLQGLAICGFAGIGAILGAPGQGPSVRVLPD